MSDSVPGRHPWRYPRCDDGSILRARAEGVLVTVRGNSDQLLARARFIDGVERGIKDSSRGH